MMKNRILEDLEGMTRKQVIALCRIYGASFSYTKFYDFDNNVAGYIMKVYAPIGSNKEGITFWFDKDDKIVNFANY